MSSGTRRTNLSCEEKKRENESRNRDFTIMTHYCMYGVYFNKWDISRLGDRCWLPAVYVRIMVRLDC